MPKKITPIKYTDRDFNSIKQSLIEHVRRYYPETFQDFNEASFGSLMLDMASYVGDVLSFHLDYQANESFLETSIEYENIVKLAKQLGYKFREAPSSTGVVSFYIVVPAVVSGFGPDMDYVPTLKKGTQLSNNASHSFILLEDVDFSRTNNEIVVATADPQTGAPLSYAIKSYGQVISGQFAQDVVDVGTFEKLRRIKLNGDHIAEILSVMDSDGHDYYEVDYLSQDVVYREISNPSTDPTAPKVLLRPMHVPRRFTVEQEGVETFLQFGYGSEDSLTKDPLTRAAEVVLQVHGKNYSTTTNFDPSNLKATDKLGVAPANTTLRINYRMNSVVDVNAATNTINNIVSPRVQFPVANLVTNKMSSVIQSLQCTNEEPIIGDTGILSGEEIKRHAIDAYASQNRAVTAQDYVSVVYRMPPRYGRVKRCNVLQDPNSLKRNLNLHVISTDANDFLVPTNQTIKENLRFWIQDYKMISDTVDILDAKIINLGVNFVVKVESDFDKYEVLEACRAEMALYFDDHFEIGEPLYITKLYKLLGNIRGVLDVFSVKLSSKQGAGYSTYYVNIEKGISDDGRILFVPSDAILEVKFKDRDIVGVAK